MASIRPPPASRSATTSSKRFQPPGAGFWPSGIGRPAELFSPLSNSLSEEDRITGRIFRFDVKSGGTISVDKSVPVHDDAQLEHNGYPVLAVPREVQQLAKNLVIDVSPSPDGMAMRLVIKSGSGL